MKGDESMKFQITTLMALVCGLLLPVGAGAQRATKKAMTLDAAGVIAAKKDNSAGALLPSSTMAEISSASNNCIRGRSSILSQVWSTA